MRLARVPGPPCDNAVAETTTKRTVGPVITTCPAPNHPSRLACNAVITPLMIRAAKTYHVR